MSKVQEEAIRSVQVIETYCAYTACDECIFRGKYNCNLIVTEPHNWDIADCKRGLEKLSHSDDEDFALHHILSEKGLWHD